MYRTRCVLALLVLHAGLAHSSFSWDFVVGSYHRLVFYGDQNLTQLVMFNDHDVAHLKYDPFNNRVLFTNRDSFSNTLFSFDIETGITQTLYHNEDSFKRYTYDPVSGTVFVLFLTEERHSVVQSIPVVKPGFKVEVDTSNVIDLGKGVCRDIAVDSCGGYIYWITTKDSIMRSRINGTEREEIINGTADTMRFDITIDFQTQKLYWVEHFDGFNRFLVSLVSSDLDGKNEVTLFTQSAFDLHMEHFAVSHDFIYVLTRTYASEFWRIPKNLPSFTNVIPEPVIVNSDLTNFDKIAANYVIEEQTQRIPLCKALERLLTNNSATNDSTRTIVVAATATQNRLTDVETVTKSSVNVTTDVSQHRVNETKDSGEDQASGDAREVSVCHNYCLQGHCSTSADGQPECRCNSGHSGQRCEVDACHAYCLNDGVCSLSETSNPVCQCTGGYQGDRCDVPVLLIKCSQTVSMLKDILSADLTSVAESKGVKSTCASTVV